MLIKKIIIKLDELKKLSHKFNKSEKYKEFIETMLATVDSQILAYKEMGTADQISDLAKELIDLEHFIRFRRFDSDLTSGASKFYKDIFLDDKVTSDTKESTSLFLFYEKLGKIFQTIQKDICEKWNKPITLFYTDLSMDQFYRKSPAELEFSLVRELFEALSFLKKYFFPDTTQVSFALVESEYNKCGLKNIIKLHLKLKNIAYKMDKQLEKTPKTVVEKVLKSVDTDSVKKMLPVYSTVESNKKVKTEEGKIVTRYTIKPGIIVSDSPVFSFAGKEFNCSTWFKNVNDKHESQKIVREYQKEYVTHLSFDVSHNLKTYFNRFNPITESLDYLKIEYSISQLLNKIFVFKFIEAFNKMENSDIEFIVIGRTAVGKEHFNEAFKTNPSLYMKLSRLQAMIMRVNFLGKQYYMFFSLGGVKPCFVTPLNNPTVVNTLLTRIQLSRITMEIMSVLNAEYFDKVNFNRFESRHGLIKPLFFDFRFKDQTATLFSIKKIASPTASDYSFTINDDLETRYQLLKNFSRENFNLLFNSIPSKSKIYKKIILNTKNDMNRYKSIYFNTDEHTEIRGYLDKSDATNFLIKILHVDEFKVFPTPGIGITEKPFICFENGLIVNFEALFKPTYTYKLNEKLAEYRSTYQDELAFKVTPIIKKIFPTDYKQRLFLKNFGAQYLKLMEKDFPGQIVLLGRLSSPELIPNTHENTGISRYHLAVIQYQHEGRLLYIILSLGGASSVKIVPSDTLSTEQSARILAEQRVYIECAATGVLDRYNTKEKSDDTKKELDTVINKDIRDMVTNNCVELVTRAIFRR